MVSQGAGRTVAAALAVLVVGATLAGTGVVGASTLRPADATAQSNATPPADATGPSQQTASDGFADTRARTQLAAAPSSASATVTATGGHASVTGTASAVANGESTLAMTQRFHLTPERRGSIDVTVRYAVPEAITTLRTEVPEGATVTGTRGFARNGSVYEWDEKSAPATISYRIAVNETRELVGPEGADGRYLFVDAGEWALLLAVVLPVVAAFEEALFRGALIGALSVGVAVDPWLLVVASSVAFGLGHGAQGRLGIAVAGGLGVALAGLFVATGSLLAVAVAHYVVNALEFVAHERSGAVPSAPETG